MMTGNAAAPRRENAARARGNREHVRNLLNVREPQFAAAVESAIQQILHSVRRPVSDGDGGANW
jgi:hypothetical protein